MKQLLIFLFLSGVFLLLSNVGFSQDPFPTGGPGGPCGGPFNPCPVPIDGGVGFLIAAGLAFGGKKYKDSRSNSPK